jgi:hypothetical protein
MSLILAVGFPLLLLWVKLAAGFAKMARRKGVSGNTALIGAFPVWAIVFGLWLMWQPETQSPAQGADGPEEDQM